MLSKGNYFPDQNSNEQIILFIRRHWLSFLYWIIFIGIMIIVPIIIFLVLKNDIIYGMPARDQEYLIIGASAYVLITMAIFLTAWISFYLNVVIITPEHLVDIRQNGLFNRRVSEQSLLRVQDVSSHRRGLMQTFFHYGTVFVETAADLPNFQMPNLPNPDKIANEILKLHEELAKTTGFDENEPDEEPEFESQVVNNRNKLPTTEFQELLKKDIEKFKKNKPASEKKSQSTPVIDKNNTQIVELGKPAAPSIAENNNIVVSKLPDKNTTEDKINLPIEEKNDFIAESNKLIKNNNMNENEIYSIKKDEKDETNIPIRENKDSSDFKQEGELEEGKVVKL
jgi:hypothetical protein